MYSCDGKTEFSAITPVFIVISSFRNLLEFLNLHEKKISLLINLMHPCWIKVLISLKTNKKVVHI